MPGPDARTIAARTPPDRDRVVDLVRLAAIAMVVLGHWLVAVVLVRDGELVTGRLLDAVPETQLLTYLFQVMPLFFLVGGAVNLRSWRQARDADTTAPIWVRRRARRLLVPILPLLALWLPLAVVLGRVGLPQREIALATEIAFLPVWFLAVYILAVGLVPTTARLHERFGPPVIVAALVGTVAVDVLLRAGAPPIVGYVNYLLVWGGIHQAGYLWTDDRLPRRPAGGLTMALTGVVAIVLLVQVLGYPLSMVATAGTTGDNSDPPTVVLWALATVQLGLILAARARLERWLERPRVWAPIALAGSVVITVFVWHMTALVVAAALTHPTGLWPATDRVDAAWWAWRPLWVLVCAAVLAVLVTIFRRFERPNDPVPRDAKLRTALGLVATVTGLALVLTGGLYTPERTTDLPLGALGLVLIGFAALGALRPRPER
jgi:hypothetical protein